MIDRLVVAILLIITWCNAAADDLFLRKCHHSMTQSLITISFFFRCHHSRHLSNTASDDNSILPAVLISIMDALSNILHTYHATLLVSMHRLRLPPLSSTFDFEVLLTTCAPWHDVVKENNRFFWSKHCHRFCSTWITCISSKTTQSNLFLILHNPTTLYVFIQSPHVQQTLHNNRFVEKSFQAASYQHTGLGNRRTFDGADDIVSQVALLF